jgi:hypothetical protein
MPNDEYLFHFFSLPNAGKNQPTSIQNLAAEMRLYGVDKTATLHKTVASWRTYVSRRNM